MGLTSDGITNVHALNSSIKDCTKNLNELNDVLNFMNTNDNFSRFIEGTAYGQETYQKWNKLIKLMTSDLQDCLNNMVKATDYFVDSQRKYNSGSSNISGSNKLNANNKTNVNAEFASKVEPNFIRYH